MLTAQPLQTRNDDRWRLWDPSGIDAPAGEAIAKALATPLHQSSVVVEPPSAGAGSWAGAPSALLVDGMYWLAYRLREPIGRGFANVVARSDDGVTFEPVAQVQREAHLWASCHPLDDPLPVAEQHRALRPRGRIGTAYNSIDRPIRDPTHLRPGSRPHPGGHVDGRATVR